MGLTYVGWSKEADMKGLFQLGHIGQAENLLPGNIALETEVKGSPCLFGREIGPFSAQRILLEDTQELLLGQGQLHGFQRGKVVSARKEGTKIHLGIIQIISRSFARSKGVSIGNHPPSHRPRGAASGWSHGT